ncbi:uncharacterized protein LOC124184015 [Neodiprion fabricii]|uniref:uncharacterized protein LOC124184015 n=1 Tax=Neodiprion fabricii TaxID=2872261 RepID=UPI001ED8E009|nr:uncharacterized protein LOC124184015 [Neodiprion fabricii]
MAKFIVILALLAVSYQALAEQSSRVLTKEFIAQLESEVEELEKSIKSSEESNTSTGSAAVNATILTPALNSSSSTDDGASLKSTGSGSDSNPEVDNNSGTSSGSQK